ncbi:hypothetical protein BCR44DRAFT_1505662 [Catenaria anguillulae PL171]|uniref:Mitochondrial distribution and morphology protein family 31/32 n=1 Tax=Catenaria anguillulae PL171 TaxID=765915 RepID=A0A1Y2H4L1_9FUNG|nr:hypothetical protein BCR44DRAFT_1505662 [Catenaria anguillulae PL171]
MIPRPSSVNLVSKLSSLIGLGLRLAPITSTSAAHTARLLAVPLLLKWNWAWGWGSGWRPSPSTPPSASTSTSTAHPLVTVHFRPSAAAAHLQVRAHFARVAAAQAHANPPLPTSASILKLKHRSSAHHSQPPWGTPTLTPPPPQPPPFYPALASAFPSGLGRAFYSTQQTPTPPTPPPPSLRSLLAHFQLKIRHFFRKPAPPPTSSSSPGSSDSSTAGDGASSSSSSTHRPWTADERLALISWLFVGNSLFILVGTTTFVSLALWLANSFQFDDVVAYALGWYVTRATGATVIFDGGLEPDWKEGRIHLRDVRVRRMHALDESTLEPHYYYEKGPFEEPLLLKGLAADDDDDEGDNDTSNHQDDDEVPPMPSSPTAALSRDENNFTKYDLSIASISVTLDLVHWLDGKGLVKTATVRGVRGIIDRRDVFWDESMPTIPIRRQHQPGDFEIADLQVDDLFVTVYNPQFRPYSVSVFHAELPQLRKQWLLYDVICATSLVGLFDNCLFSVHAPQLPVGAGGSSSSSLPVVGAGGSAASYASPLAASADGSEDDETSIPVSAIPRRISRLKIDNVPIDHLNYGTTGPFGWITGGTLDISATIHIPRQRRPQDVDKLLAQLMHELKASARDRITLDDLGRLPDKVQQVIREVPAGLLPDAFRSTPAHAAAAATAAAKAEARTPLVGPPTPPPTLAELAATATQPYLLMDLQLKFNNIRASVPLLPPSDPSTPSYLTTTALIRPVVAYMNAHRTAIPLACRLAMPLSDFDGAWTIYNAGLSDALATGVGKAMVDGFLDEAERARRIRKVGLWSVRTVAEGVAGVLSGGKGLVQFLEGVMRSQMRLAVQNEGALGGDGWEAGAYVWEMPPVERRR